MDDWVILGFCKPESVYTLGVKKRSEQFYYSPCRDENWWLLVSENDNLNILNR
jgi:hypothetical protein